MSPFACREVAKYYPDSRASSFIIKNFIKLDLRGINIDLDIHRRIAEGDEGSFALLYNKFSPSVHAYANRITGSAGSADEVVQETFLRIWLSRDKLESVENLKGWVFTIAANETIRFLRKKITYEKKLRDKLELSTQTSIQHGPDAEVQARHIRNLVLSCIEDMPHRKKLIYRLSREEGLKPAAIAEQLSLSVGTVKNVLSQALHEIRDHLLKSGITISIAWLFLKKFI